MQGWLRMMLTLGLLWAAHTARADDAAGAGIPAKPKGSLAVIGGGLRFADPEVWTRIVELAGGKGASIAVFPTASDNPAREAEFVVKQFRQYGAEPFVVPAAFVQTDVDYRQVIADPQLVAAVGKAGGLFLIGGEQARITRALRTEQGEDTPMLAAIRELYQRGGIIAGTSAGAAIMSRIMCREAPSVLATLQHGVTMGKEIDRGLGFMPPAWYVEQHVLTRGRFGRAIAIMHDQGFKYGIGIDDNSAFIVRNGRDVEVMGYKGALLIDLSEIQRDPDVSRFNLKNVKLSYLDSGDFLNLDTREVTPAECKRAESKIEPFSATFQPYNKQRLFYNDVFANSVLHDILYKLIEHESHEALGLAFDGHAARQQSVPGFEFRFYRTPESVGYYTGSRGGDDFTVLNIRLDIRPIDIQGPLYK